MKGVLKKKKTRGNSTWPMLMCYAGRPLSTMVLAQEASRKKKVDDERRENGVFLEGVIDLVPKRESGDARKCESSMTPRNKGGS